MAPKKFIFINIAALSQELLELGLNKGIIPNIQKIISEGFYTKMDPLFPGLTCSVQATMLTGKPPRDHGIVGNGFFDKHIFKPSFWAQEGHLVKGPRIWDWMREKEKTTAVIFWQNSKYINADFVLTPSPIHTEKGMIEWVYSKPIGLYENLIKKIRSFSLKDYWGPFVSIDSSEWIVNSAIEIFKDYKPDLSLVYIPHLDYYSQRCKPYSQEVIEELKKVDILIGMLLSLREIYKNLDFFIVSEYGLVEVNKTLYPNLTLRENDLLVVREIEGKEYIDFELSKAFVLVDHQIAHLYLGLDFVRNNKPSIRHKLINELKELFKKVGIKALDKEEQEDFLINHERSGDLILLAPKDSWFGYNYWTDQHKRPFFADDVDIHNKPGYDPLELFLINKRIPSEQDLGLIKGSHGLPASDPKQYAIFITSIKDLKDYAPKEFSATHILSMLYRVI